MSRLLWLGWLLAWPVLFGGCAATPKYAKEDCPLYTEIGTLRANPAGALDRHLRLEAAFRVCPPDAGLAEIKRKHIEVKHHLLALLSAKTRAQLEDPLVIEKLQQEILQTVNRQIFKKSRAEEVFITSFELE